MKKVRDRVGGRRAKRERTVAVKGTHEESWCHKDSVSDCQFPKILKLYCTVVLRKEKELRKETECVYIYICISI